MLDNLWYRWLKRQAPTIACSRHFCCLHVYRRKEGNTKLYKFSLSFCMTHQSTVPPASASIFMNSWVICSLERLPPKWGPSLSQNSSMSSSPLPSSSASCEAYRVLLEGNVLFDILPMTKTPYPLPASAMIDDAKTNGLLL